MGDEVVHRRMDRLSGGKVAQVLDEQFVIERGRFVEVELGALLERKMIELLIVADTVEAVPSSILLP